jgi:hypothetical protein
MVHWLHLWHYYQRPSYLLGGVAWSNIFYSGILTTSCYGAVRLAARWSRVEAPVLVGAGGPPTTPVTADVRWRDFAMGAAAIWSAFYLSMTVHLIWYASTHPWVPAPHPL